jgi:hypothetical protein
MLYELCAIVCLGLIAYMLSPKESFFFRAFLDKTRSDHKLQCC